MKKNYLDNVEIIWANNYYDCPLSGLAIYNNDVYYFSIESDYEDKEKIYKLMTYPDDIMLNILKRKLLFENQVGFHCTYKNGRKIKTFSSKDNPEWKEFDYGDIDIFNEYETFIGYFIR